MNDNLTNTSVENDDYLLFIKSIDSVSGDCDVTQRKGKVLCIFDMKLVFTVEGTKKVDEKEVAGTITIEEFVHDQEEDEILFVIKSDHSAEIKKHLVPVLKTKLLEFQPALILAHEKDVQHNSR